MENMTGGQITCVRTDFACSSEKREGTCACSARRMDDRVIRGFREALEEREKSPATIQKYLRDLGHFCLWLNGGRITNDTDTTAVTDAAKTSDSAMITSGAEKSDSAIISNSAEISDTVITAAPARLDPVISKDRVREYKQYLRERFKISTANSRISALNAFLKYAGWYECCVTTFKTQRETFRSTEKDLSVQEYQRILRAADGRKGRGQRGGHQLALIMETLAGTGIRVSELPFITVASLNTRRTTVSLKGKSRVILLPAQLCKKLRAYCRDRSITEGSIFVTRTGRPLDRTNILHRMKELSGPAGVSRGKIFPHNLRHLFAVTYYEKEKDIVRLADLLGHSSINTTRIYTLVSCQAQLDILDRIGDLLAPVWI